MATTRKRAATKTRTTRKKTGARKRKARVGEGPKETITISGVGKFKKTTCHRTKSDAQKSAEGMRSRGKRARVIQSGSGYCVYSRGKSRKAA